MPKMHNIPLTLKHKPILAINNYDQIDGPFAGNTDALYLSIGKAQYEEESKQPGLHEISLKVWRHSEERWSRQSEEIPPHRVLALTILLLRCYMNNFGKDIIKSEISDRVFVTDWKDGDIEDVKRYLQSNSEYLQPLLKEIKGLLDNMSIE